MDVMIEGISARDGIAIAPPGKLTLAQGDKVRITAGFDYIGPAQTVTLRGAVTQGTVERLFNERLIPIPNSTVVTHYTSSVVIPVTTAIPVGTGYDVIAFLIEVPSATISVVGCIDIIAASASTVSQYWWLLAVGGVALVALVLPIDNKVGKK